MALLAQLAEHPQTVLEMQAALEARYTESLALAAEGCHTGAIYLLGYVAEITLKVAYFLAARGGEALNAPWAVLEGWAKSHANDLRQRGHGVSDVEPLSLADFHDLHFWRTLLIDVRTQQGWDWDEELKIAFRDALVAVGSNWSVGLRYVSEFATFDDYRTVDRGADWLRTHRVRLWRE